MDQADLNNWAAYLRESGLQLYRRRGTTPNKPAVNTPEPKPTPATSATASQAPTSPTAATTSAAAVETLEDIRRELGDCDRCPLHEGRNNIVFGEGNPQARLMFVGEGPGADEDRTGRPFVGKAGQLLDKMIAAMGLQRDQVYIANIIKSRPPNNRDPNPEEIAACFPFLQRQIRAIQPEVIVTLGKPAARALVGLDGAITRYRGHWQSYETIAVMPTYHPAYLLRNAAEKRNAWADLQAVMQHLGLASPG